MIAGTRRHAGTSRVVQAPRVPEDRPSSGPMDQLRDRFRPRPVQGSWAATRRPRDEVQSRLLASPLLANLPYATRRSRVIGLIAVLDWLQAQPGETWQDRWIASGADA